MQCVTLHIISVSASSPSLPLVLVSVSRQSGQTCGRTLLFPLFFPSHLLLFICCYQRSDTWGSITFFATMNMSVINCRPLSGYFLLYLLPFLLSFLGSEVVRLSSFIIRLVVQLMYECRLPSSKQTKQQMRRGAGRKTRVSL